MKKKVFVTGCFDLFHSGHVSFLKTAHNYGDVYVCIGSDETVNKLKGRFPIISEKERKYVLESSRYVKKCIISKGSGMMDFINEINEIQPDIFIVNNDGNTKEKSSLCKKMGIKYLVLDRKPSIGLPNRSSSALREKTKIPYRIDLAGGWLDQPFVNKFNSGSVITISIEPNIKFNYRSGMATSTREKAIELWGISLPREDPKKLAKLLFSFENPPGTKEISGSQDALGITLPGVNRLFYQKEYWPKKIESVDDELILKFLEKVIYLLPLKPRDKNYNALKKTNISKDKVINLSNASQNVWQSIIKKDVKSLGKYFLESFSSQIKIFPNMLNKNVEKVIDNYKKRCLGYKLSGAGGGGYLILINNKPIDGTFKIKIRRNNK